MAGAGLTTGEGNGRVLDAGKLIVGNFPYASLLSISNSVFVCCCKLILFPPKVFEEFVLVFAEVEVFPNENEVEFPEPNDLFPPKLNELVVGVANVVPKPLEVFEVPVFPKEKELVEEPLLEVLFPKLNEFVLPVLLLLLLFALPKLKVEGEFEEGALKFPKVFVPELVVLLLDPNPPEKFPNDGVLMFPKVVEGVEVDDWPKENDEVGVLVLDLFPKEKGEFEVVFEEDEVFPNVDGVIEPNEKDDAVFEEDVFWPKVVFPPPKEEVLVLLPNFLYSCHRGISTDPHLN